MVFSQYTKKYLCRYVVLILLKLLCCDFYCTKCFQILRQNWLFITYIYFCGKETKNQKFREIENWIIYLFSYRFIIVVQLGNLDFNFEIPEFFCIWQYHYKYSNVCGKIDLFNQKKNSVKPLCTKKNEFILPSSI